MRSHVRLLSAQSRVVVVVVVAADDDDNKWCSRKHAAEDGKTAVGGSIVTTTAEKNILHVHTRTSIRTHTHTLGFALGKLRFSHDTDS